MVAAGRREGLGVSGEQGSYLRTREHLLSRGPPGNDRSGDEEGACVVLLYHVFIFLFSGPCFSFQTV